MITTRRGFLGAFSSLVVWAPDSATLQVETPARTPIERLIDIVPSDAAQVLGREYAVRWPSESTPDKLVDLISKSTPAIKQQLTAADPKLRRDAFDRLVIQDFEQGQTAEVHGWVLSRTEARLFALAVLTHSRGQ